MGYYTRYSIDIVSGDFPNEQYEESLEDAISQEPELVNYGNPFDDSCKWYDHSEHMKKISSRYPGVVFCLHGEGEESGDIWDKYYKNGKEQVCHAVMSIPPFDETKLI